MSFFNLPHLCCIRELRTDKIASLVAFTGTVTRLEPPSKLPPASSLR